MEAGYLGVGAMGQPMSHKLLDAGHSLTIYDINETAMLPLLEGQARRGASPRDLADRCEIVFVSLPTLAAFREVRDRTGDGGVRRNRRGLPDLRRAARCPGRHTVGHGLW